MPRPLRLEFQDAWYHVMNRGAGYRKIFSSEKHRTLFLDLLGEATKLYGIEIHGYCLMDNHYHLLVKTPTMNLSRAMRHINGVYTQRYNRTKTDGSLFRGRYKAIVVEEDEYLLQVSRYIHLNPVAANMVKQAQKYAWSSYRYYLEIAEKPAWLKTQEILSMLASKSSVTAYQRFVSAGNDNETENFYERDNIPVIFGSDLFRKKLLKCIKQEEASVAITDYNQVRILPGLDKISQACAQYFKVDKRNLYRSRRGTENEPRKIAIYGSRMWGRATSVEIATHFNFKSHSRVTNIVTEMNRRLKAEPPLGKVLHKIYSEID